MSIVQKEYEKDSKLKPNDVKQLQEWLQSQPHLPKMTELEVIWFLQSCYFSNEAAKTAIDTYFTMKTMSPEVFGTRNTKLPAVRDSLNVATYTMLPQKTSEGYSILFARLHDGNPDNFNFNNLIRHFDMVTMLNLHQNGTMEGFIIVFDMENVVFGHLIKLGIVSMKKFLYYLQDGLPVRLKGLHYINIVPFMDKILALMKPFMKKELMDVLHLHEKPNGLSKFIPMDCMPSDYGGKAGSCAELHAKMVENLTENSDFLSNQDQQLVDESKRPGKPKTASDIFGVEGTFKKMDLD